MGKSNSQTKQSRRLNQEQAEMGRQLLAEVAPLRSELIGQAGDFLGSDVGITDELFSLPQFQALKASGDAQFQRVRDNIISNTPEGGGLTSALTNADTARALAEAKGAGAIADDTVNRALQLASGGTAQGSNIFGNATNVQMELARAQSEQNAAKASGAGQFAGAIAAPMMPTGAKK
jgi:hypothetical protein